MKYYDGDERSLSEKEIRSSLGYDYNLDDAIRLLSEYQARGESVSIYFNGYKLSLKNTTAEELKKKYLDYAEDLRKAFLYPGSFHYDEGR